MDNKKTEVIISRRDERAFEELALDRKAADASLNVAISHHHNLLIEIDQSELKLHEHCIEAYNLDENKEYSVTRSLKDRRTVLTETDEGEE